MSSRPWTAVKAVAVAFVVVIGCSACSAPPSEPIPPTDSRAPSSPAPSTTSTPTPVPRTGWWHPTGEPVTLASGLASPWSVVPLPGGGALISERDSGLIRELTAAGQLRDVGIVPDVVAGGEAGLHGLALRPDSSQPFLYAYHGAPDENRVVRMPLLGDPGGFSLGSAETVVTGIRRAGNHNGGRIAFGPDGFLYITTGDAGDPDASQDPASLNGKILRVTADGEPAPGNPFGTAVWSLGHRNVQGIAWTSDGTMWASEFGQNTWDELNRIEPGSNYGWPIVEGTGDDARFTQPIAVWATSDASPSGIAAVGETVFIAGLRGQTLWVVDTDGGALAAEPFAGLTGQGRLRDAVTAPDGTLWVLTNNTDGRGSPRDGDDVLLALALSQAG